MACTYCGILDEHKIFPVLSADKAWATKCLIIYVITKERYKGDR